jgi:hypothetical protein
VIAESVLKIARTTRSSVVIGFEQEERTPAVNQDYVILHNITWQGALFIQVGVEISHNVNVTLSGPRAISFRGRAKERELGTEELFIQLL